MRPGPSGRLFNFAFIVLNWSSPRQVTQGDMTFRNAKPWWLMPATIRSTRLFMSPEKPRATHVAPNEIASSHGSTEGSGFPKKVDFVLSPDGVVGAACPLVSP